MARKVGRPGAEVILPVWRTQPGGASEGPTRLNTAARRGRLAAGRKVERSELQWTRPPLTERPLANARLTTPVPPNASRAPPSGRGNGGATDEFDDCKGTAPFVFIWSLTTPV